jgi:hypothetical protein
MRFAFPALVTVRCAADCVGRWSHAHRHVLCVSVSLWLILFFWAAFAAFAFIRKRDRSVTVRLIDM